MEGEQNNEYNSNFTADAKESQTGSKQFRTT